MFGMRHCKAHLCNLNGANSLEEADRWPLEPCPDCLAKLLWLTGTTPGEWMRGVLSFYEEHGLGEEAERTRRHLSNIQASTEPDAR
jgi:archaemetzincin